eukprot:Em0027g52a
MGASLLVAVCMSRLATKDALTCALTVQNRISALPEQQKSIPTLDTVQVVCCMSQLQGPHYTAFGIHESPWQGGEKDQPWEAVDQPVYLLPRTWCSLRGNPRDPKVVSPSGSVPYDVGINLSCGSDPHDRLIPVSCSIEEVVLDHPRKGLSHHGYFVKVKLKRLPQDIAFLKILPTSSPVHSHSHQKLFGHPSGPQSSPYPSQCRALGVSTTSDSDHLSEEAGHLKSHMRELGEATASLERSHDLETHLLKGNRTLQEQSVECEQPKEEYRWLREELNVTRATLPVQCDITIDTPTQTICSEPDGKETGDLAQKKEKGKEERKRREGKSKGEREQEQEPPDREAKDRQKGDKSERGKRAEKDKRKKERESTEGKGRHEGTEPPSRNPTSLYTLLPYLLLPSPLLPITRPSLSLLSLSPLLPLFHPLPSPDVCKSRPSGSGHESFQILPRESQLGAQATLLAKALVSNTREWELLQLSAANMKPELKCSGDDLTTLQMEKTASRDKERVKMLSFQTELVKQLLAEKTFP